MSVSPATASFDSSSRTRWSCGGSKEHGKSSMFTHVWRILVNATTIRFFMVLIATAIIAGSSTLIAEICPPVTIVALVILALHSCITAVLLLRRRMDIRWLATCGIVLAYFAIASIFCDEILPVLSPPCKFVALSLALPYLTMALKQLEKVHILIAICIVTPTIYCSIIVGALPAATRFALYMPALIFSFYKWIAAWCTSGRLQHSAALEKSRLFRVRAVVLVGAAVAGAGSSLDLQKPFALIFVAGGSVLSMLGVIALNYVMLVLRWEAPQPTIPATAPALRSSLGSIALLLLMSADLFFIFICLEFFKSAAILPIMMLFCIYLFFVDLHDSIRGIVGIFTSVFRRVRNPIPSSIPFPNSRSGQMDERTPIFIYIILIVLLIAEPFAYLIYAPPSESTTNNRLSISTSTVPSTVPDDTLSAEENALGATSFYGDMASMMLLMHFMMTVLHKTDKQAIEAAKAAVLRSQQQLSDFPRPLQVFVAPPN